MWSYDLHETSTKFVPRSLSLGRWHFIQGDARESVPKAPEFDYLFVDSDHSRGFAGWYVKELFPRIRPGTVVSVHGVFHTPAPSEEGAVVVLDWLAQKGLTFWTPSSVAGGPACETIS